MIINRIGLCNFGSFDGEVLFDISINDTNKNVILVGGKNGAGKTTLFTAIKIGLYGPLALGYDTTSSSYYRRVKRLINKNSLSKKNVNTYVTLEFILEEERELSSYKLIRKWKYEDQKLVESFSVTRNGINLSEEDHDRFENFLKTLIPPQLFDLFFFDGEKISDFFLDGNSSKNLRDALLLLCGYDTFDIMHSNFKRIHSKGSSVHLDEDEKNVSTLSEEFEKNKTLLDTEKEKLISIENEIKNLNEKLAQLEKEFRKAGGLLAQEVAKYRNDISKEEKFREEKNEWLKDYANNQLPFLLVKDLVQDVKSQIIKENKYQKYIAIKDSLNEDFLKQVINDEIANSKIRIVDEHNNNTTNSFSSVLAKHIDDKIKPDFDLTQFKPIHYLSHDDENDTLTLIKDLEEINSEQVKNCKAEIKKSIAKAQNLRKKLEACEKNDEMILNFTKEIDITKAQLNDAFVEKGKTEIQIDNLYKNVSELESKLKKAREILASSRKEKSIIALCDNASKLLANYIPVLVNKKLDIVKENFMFMFKQLIAKKDYIHSIDIDSNFNVTLYRRNIQSVSTLETMLTKIGMEAFEGQMGTQCVDTLLKALNISKKSELEKVLSNLPADQMFELPVKVDIKGFSKGEQQIYIMSLYWALIKMSNNKIPFVIDTPYARIDSIHRERITTSFFPTLSSQVMILSTDEEINNEYYALIKPYVSKEFLITYSDAEYCTNVEEKYFFEVVS
ncbi:DNA sulfur modification protein DndD [Acetivibrio cellulolyticus]|uniref:DNA sulfur modification protein DndD n=1 Tax=Acetivibrio cellulolyticus TaxID=35830 RepID=UPI0001E2D0B9|nr:DNA sulfur modification protein DndD [Acetivibrio cellulolyticus]